MVRPWKCGLVGVVSLSSLALGGGVAIADEPERLSVDEVVSAIGELDGDLIVASVERFKTDAGSAVIVEDSTMRLDVSRSPEEGVSIAAGTVEVGIALPVSDDAVGMVTEEGLVVYPSTDGTAQAISAGEGVVQILSTISNAEAPSRFVYPLTFDTEVTFASRADGSLSVLDPAGRAVLEVAAPWARDAAGNHVPTYFEIAGDALVQVVEHDLGHYEYPIVADPEIGYPVTTLSLRNKSKVSSTFRATQSFASCQILRKGGTCTITQGKSVTRTVELALGIGRQAVAGQLGIGSESQVSTSVACSSPPMPAGATWRAYAVGSRYQYQVRKVTMIGYTTVVDSTSGWLYAFDPNPQRVSCG